MRTSARFEVTIEGTHGIVIPNTVAQPFIDEGHSRVAVQAFFEDRKISFHGKLHRFNDRFMISFGKRYQQQLGVATHDFFDLILLEDTSKYGVDMPEEFQAVLESDLEAMDWFEKISDGKKRSLIYYITRFKNEQTRIDKALIISENLKMGITDPKELTINRR